MNVQIRPYQNKAINAVFNEWREGNRRTLLVMATGCHSLETELLMSDGRIKNVKDIKKGEELIGPDGRPRKVLKIHEGINEMYKIVPNKGAPFIVTKDHMLSLIKTNEHNDRISHSPQIADVTVEEYLGWNKHKKHIYKLFRSEEIEFNTNFTPTIDPYFLGVILGDGAIAHQINITTMDEEVVECLEKESEKYGAHLRSQAAGKAKTYFFVNCRNLRKQLNKLGLTRNIHAYNKFIPFEYKTASTEIRKQVLAGLIDTDGSLSCNTYDYITASKQLAEDICFIARSLGLACYVKKVKKKCQNNFAGEYYRLCISGETSKIPCKVVRKKAKQRTQKKNVLRTGFKIEKLKKERYIGFTVDGDNRYLMSDFTVTHNCGKTITFGAIAAKYVSAGARVLILAHREELLTQARDKIENISGIKAEIEKAELHASKDAKIVVASMASLSREKRLKRFKPDDFSVIIIDEAHHVLNESYKKIFNYFKKPLVLGVTATPERGDRKKLGSFFDSIAFEYSIKDAVEEGYLVPIKAKTIPLQLDISKVKVSAGDFQAGELGSALEPYLDEIGDKMLEYCKGRKTVIFAPLIKTAKLIVSILNKKGFKAVEVDGNSKDRTEIVNDFANGKYNVIVNAMLLTEGWDCPAVDCIIVLRPTKSKGLYCLDEETEILTKDGWKKDVEIGEEVLTFNKDTGESVFKPVLAKVRREMEQDEYFVSIKGQSSDIRVTNKHRMLYDNKRRKGWKIKTAEEVADLKDGVYLPVSGKGKFKGVPLTDAELTFIGWVMTDGTINKSNNAITISQSSHHKGYCDEITKCIEECGFKYSKHIIKRKNVNWTQNGDNVIWTISKGNPRGRDKDKTGWGKLEKWLSKDLETNLFDMTEKQFGIMLKAIFHGDGSKNVYKDSYHIRKGNKIFIERLQMMAIQRGYRASVSVEKRNENKQDIYAIHLKKQEYIKAGSIHGKHAKWKKEKHTDEKCWCVETEQGTIYTRRNGKVAILGNCQMVGRGTRTCPETNKKDLLILDFLWLTNKYELCHPTTALDIDEEVAKKMTTRMAEDNKEYDLLDLKANEEERLRVNIENAMIRDIIANSNKKGEVLDLIHIQALLSSKELSDYKPRRRSDWDEATEKQKVMLRKYNIDENITKGEASAIIDVIVKRGEQGLASINQMKSLISLGFKNVGKWTYEEASKTISMCAKTKPWAVPKTINASTFDPKKPFDILGKNVFATKSRE